MNKKKLLIIGLVAAVLASGPYLSRFFIGSENLAAELATSSVFDIPIEEKCDYQDELDQKFTELDASSGNYDVIYTSYKRKYSADKYTGCTIPESRRYVDEDLASRGEEIKDKVEPVIEVIEGSGSEMIYAGSTYYEKSYNYVPEVPTPSFEYPAP